MVESLCCCVLEHMHPSLKEREIRLASEGRCWKGDAHSLVVCKEMIRDLNPMDHLLSLFFYMRHIHLKSLVFHTSYGNAQCAFNTCPLPSAITFPGPQLQPAFGHCHQQRTEDLTIWTEHLLPPAFKNHVAKYTVE
ncbi:epidermal growth factor receptor [Platysternon megacephalum]|uniref:Epidermal growth factor receptor n=1 Tax=Platysternon megacephalum TaxID=55544 RepID=A0A4D9E4D8_9SAUR|nr:epidermal growth factor receptor [Platysternon megacephalum]